MSPKSLFFLLAVGLCATQTVSANREARAVSDFFSTATSKLYGYLTNAESPIQSSIETVQKYILDMEDRFLTAGTKALKAAKINMDLKDVATIIKGKVNVCANDKDIRNNAKAILNDMASCITNDVATLENLVLQMKDLWQTAKSMPKAIKDVIGRCQSDDAVPEVPLRLTADSNHELAAATNELLESTSKHVSKRSLDGIMRMAGCARKIFDFAKSDLVNGIPGDVINAATHAFQIYRSVQGGIPACVATRATANIDDVTLLGVQVRSCIANGITDGEIANSDSFKALQQIANVASAINDLQSGGTLNAVGKIGKMLG